MTRRDRQEDDSLVGMWFEMGGGLGRMTGRIHGKAGELYLIQRDGVQHFELMELDDLRAARFFAAGGQGQQSTGAGTASQAGAGTERTAIRNGARADNADSQGAGAQGAGMADGDNGQGKKRRLGDQIRRAVRTRSDKSD